MELIRLKELLESAQTAQAAEVLQEGAKHTKDFDGIRGIVDDCIADLREKIGKGGMLATLMKESGASKLDTVKDADGKNVLNQIIAKTTEYTKAIEKLMTEAELLVSQVNEGAAPTGKVLVEGKDYSDSSEFTDEFYGIVQQVAKMKQAMKNPRWLAWMKTTDSNFGTETEVPARAAIQAVNSLDAQLSDIDAEFDKAN